MSTELYSQINQNKIVSNTSSNSELQPQIPQDRTAPERTVGGKISRRDFLKYAVGVGVTGSLSTLVFRNKNIKDLFGIHSKSESEELIRCVIDILNYRNKLGLVDLPDETDIPYRETAKREEQWQKTEPFFNRLPIKNQSYGSYVFEVLKTLFGNKASKIVKEVSNQENRNGMCFFGGDLRMFNIPDWVHSVSIDSQFLDYILHEAAGHGSDPSLQISYPREVLLKIERGKWRALSQAFSIEGQMFRHPKDLMLPYIKRQTGASAALVLANNGVLTDIVEGKNVISLRNALETVAAKKKVVVNDLVFNKSTCYLLGDFLVEEYLKHQLSLVGKVRDTYQENLEWSMKEIYAEMFKYTLAHPDLIGDNSEVVEGITEVLSVISRQRVDIVKLREAIKQPSPEILMRNREEKELIAQTTTTLSPEEQAQAKAQEEKRLKEEREFNAFMKEGIIPDAFNGLPEEAGKRLRAYAKTCSTIIKKYSMLINTHAQHLNTSFDPNLHIWEIQKIEGAIDSSFIKSTLFSPEQLPGNLDKITQNTDILTKFINSKAF